MQAQALGKAQEIKERRPILGTLGQALTKLFAPDLVDSTVDGMVTPEAILNNPTVVEHREKDESFVDFITYAFFTGPEVQVRPERPGKARFPYGHGRYGPGRLPLARRGRRGPALGAAAVQGAVAPGRP